MNARIPWAAVAIPAVLSACTFNDPKNTARLRDGTNTSATCALGETLMPFTLQPLPEGVIPSLEPFPSIAPGESLAPASPDNNIRLDFCVSDTTGESKLKSILIYRKGGSPERDILALDPDGIASDLFELMAGNPSAFQVNQRPSQISQWATSFMMLGTGQGDAGFSVAGIAVLDGENRLTAINGGWLAGKLVVGDPFSEGVCPFGQNLVPESFTIGTARLDLDLCQETMNVDGRRYTIVRVGVTDTNSHLPEAAQGFREFKGAELERVLEYKVTHHNSADSLILKLPEVTYERHFDVTRVFTGVKYGESEWIRFEAAR